MIEQVNFETVRIRGERLGFSHPFDRAVDADFAAYHARAMLLDQLRHRVMAHNPDSFRVTFKAHASVVGFPSPYGGVDCSDEEWTRLQVPHEDHITVVRRLERG